MRYLNGPTGDLVDTVLARESAGGTIAWYLPDRLGTIRDLINNSGSIIDHVDYSAFGTVLDESSPSNGDRMMGFAGMERDTVTGLNLAVNRVQNPGTGRWTSQDPLGFAAGDANLYRYVSNDPANRDDPSGEIPSVNGPPRTPGQITRDIDRAEQKRAWLRLLELRLIDERFERKQFILNDCPESDLLYQLWNLERLEARLEKYQDEIDRLTKRLLNLEDELKRLNKPKGLLPLELEGGA